ncbi:helix-turn-helix transcriptional regulator [Streptomyces sp. NPDC048352]|uniref:helix-turn-helix domain-containing protein n=1 Tax=Streptomyces sp. NPDC048352 TaxID=3154718 RepID=UPI00343EF378
MDSDPRRRFAEELKSARELYPERRLTQTDLARLARTSKSTISRLESGKGPIPPELPAVLDQIFGTDGVFRRLDEEMAIRSSRAIHRRRREVERSASAVWEWSPTLVPGLLQTSGYARALLRVGAPVADEEQLTAMTRARLARQEILQGPRPPHLRVVLCESVILRRFVPAPEMWEQLAALVSHSERPTTSIRILPLNAEPNLLIDVPLSILTSPTHVQSVCIDSYRTARIITEPEDVRDAVRAFGDLEGEALPAQQSVELIRRQMASLT